MKLIIHMGYPKTATTTLQNNFFEKLDSNRYNFIGRSYLTNNQKEVFKFLMGYKTKFDFNIFSKEKVNILSEEGLTTGCDLSNENIARDKSLIRDKILEMKYLLENYYNTEVDILLLFVIRNQANLLESLYIELYNSCFKFVNDLNTPHKFANNLEKYKYFFDWFDYYNTINFFSEKLDCKTFLFETLQENNEFFKIFGNEYSNNVMDKKYNVKTSKEVSKSYSLGVFLIDFLKKIKVLDFFYFLKKRNKVMDELLTKWFNYLNKLQIEKGKMHFSKEDKEIIMQYYKNKNRFLVNFLPEEELKKHNYF